MNFSTNPIIHLIQGKWYKLSWSTNPNWTYKLMSWDNSGNCVMESAKGKKFTTHTKHLIE